MKIYTRKGDEGMSSLFGGTQISKTDPRLDAYGSCDELNSLLGWALAEVKKTESLSELCHSLEKIQSSLFVVGSRLATDNADMRQKLSNVNSKDTDDLEKAMDKMNESLPELKSFILPGGGEAACRLHIARSTSRRAERSVLYFYQAGDESDKLIMAYLNRLSDFLFVAARFANQQQGTKDVPWTS